MQKRKLGTSGLEVSPLCFGTNVFGWTVDEATAFSLLDALVAAGFNFIDTADIYPRWVPGNKGGESETIIGKWLSRSGNRSKVILATKVGMEMAPDKKGLAKKYILRAAEESLQRLQTDYIDLYQAHQDDPNTPLDETLEAFNQLVQQGKVRVLGASNFNTERLEQSLQTSKSHDYAAYQCLQPLYNLYDRADYETLLEPYCVKHQLGVIPYFSLASGFLTGKYRSDNDLSKSSRGEGVKKYLNDRGMRILRALDQVANEYKCTQSQVALAWLIARPSITAPIASATNLSQLNELIAATKIKLEADAIHTLDITSG